MKQSISEIKRQPILFKCFEILSAIKGISLALDKPKLQILASCTPKKRLWLWGVAGWLGGWSNPILVISLKP